jgi:hypothetical protein
MLFIYELMYVISMLSQQLYSIVLTGSGRGESRADFLQIHESCSVLNSEAKSRITQIPSFKTQRRIKSLPQIYDNSEFSALVVEKMYCGTQ